jgi:hypothetical protein
MIHHHHRITPIAKRWQAESADLPADLNLTLASVSEWMGVGSEDSRYGSTTLNKINQKLADYRKFYLETDRDILTPMGGHATCDECQAITQELREAYADAWTSSD